MGRKTEDNYGMESVMSTNKEQLTRLTQNNQHLYCQLLEMCLLLEIDYSEIQKTFGSTQNYFSDQFQKGSLLFRLQFHADQTYQIISLHSKSQKYSFNDKRPILHYLSNNPYICLILTSLHNLPKWFDSLDFSHILGIIIDLPDLPENTAEYSNKFPEFLSLKFLNSVKALGLNLNLPFLNHYSDYFTNSSLLRNLEICLITHCKLSQIPEWIFTNPNLKALGLFHNSFLIVSESIQKLPFLEILMIHDTPLYYLPLSLDNCPNLHFFSLFDTNIKSISHHMQKLAENGVKIRGNFLPKYDPNTFDEETEREQFEKIANIEFVVDEVFFNFGDFKTHRSNNGRSLINLGLKPLQD